VAEQLAVNLILHGHVVLAADVIAELRLDHREGRFDVTPLVVVLEELVPMERVEQERLLSESAGGACLAPGALSCLGTVYNRWRGFAGATVAARNAKNPGKSGVFHPP
jgi:hypothetical protein